MTKTELKQLKIATEKLTKWESSGKAFGYYKIIEQKATDQNLSRNKGADKIYEFFCLMKLLEDLLISYTIKLGPGTKLFPEAPSSKKGWAYFVIEDKVDVNKKFQVCYGTKIKLSGALKTTIAPDITIQKSISGDDPDETMVELIMDAKFKYNDESTLPINQIHAFIQQVNALETKDACTIPLTLIHLKDLKSNCLITNGKALREQHDYCVINNIKQVEGFSSNGQVYNVVG